MAALLHHSGERRITLSSPCLIGRSSACALRIDDRQVSGEHARLVWTGVQWELRDLGSRNGTWVDGRRLTPGNPEPLAQGSRIAFGRESEAWLMVDAEPPTLMARNEASGELLVATGGLLALPNAETPVVVVIEETAGIWMIEQGDRFEAAIDQQLLDVGGEAWRLLIPWVHEMTLGFDPSLPSGDELALRFVVSRDQEHVELIVRHAGGEVAMTPRVHFFLLLLLARKRLEDRARALTKQEQGWVYVEELIEGLRTDPERLNVDVYRIRRQFTDAGISGAARLIERRRLTRQLRIATDMLEIIQN
jgi:hypothetical protein